jgi:toxin ParE1/3/4
MAQYKLTEDAQEDLRELKEFSLKRFGRLVTREYLAGLRVTLQHLAKMPDMGTNESEDLMPGVWSFPYVSHTLYYQKIEAGIVVIGLLHQSRLPELLLKR